MMEVLWEFCPGRYRRVGLSYRTCRGQLRGVCGVCGADHALISGGRMRHHFRRKAGVS